MLTLRSYRFNVWVRYNDEYVTTITVYFRKLYSQNNQWI